MFKRLGIFVLAVTLLLCITGGEARASITDGLVAYYPFNGNANDESGNGNNGTVYGATLTTDRNGNANSAYSFDGTNDYIQANDPLSSATTNFTITAWINPTQTDTSRKEIVNGGDYSVTNAGYHLYLDNNKARFDLSNHESTVSQNSIGSNSWTFLVGLIDNGSIKLYVNGILESTSTSTAHLSPINLMIGKIQDNRSSYWNGKIDDVRIYNRALSDSEIQELYQEGSNAITLTLTPPTTTTVSQGSKLGPFSISIKNNTSSSYTSYVYIYLVSPDETWKTLISKSLTFQPARHLPLITCTRISHPLYRRDHTIIG